ncbi:MULTISPECIES: phosphopantetheine-binding protein [Ralstonia solanacearum species complex]|uniref:Acyl carrier protein n=3 Tax=Ralstonia solanacearum species complex TaxID=3116862 RepID=A0A0K1ZG80_RALSL|nr:MULTISPECIES: phosphopantetheine-binding protein [Ralstonia]AKZ25029.1 hypothetical protein ACH51_00690 [Ralstonia solanacearum]APF89803.1 hypothetical protein BCR16_23790 [Ralstonia solanacearum FJAT-1458]ARS58687.1 hypothetical protein BC427_21335 [Ralstonia solanacearum FJAT-91]AVV67639.1 hypothetical protein RSOE_06550 [Ralstonia solanacearum OE1-1]ESS49642.1 hypothetical protein L665_04335 [Ralstonia solanacearum SD54]
MSTFTVAELVPFINAVVTPPVTEATLSAQPELSALGIDSLSTVNLLVALAEHFNADLSAYVDALEPPRTIPDLQRIATLFMEDGRVIHQEGN